MCIITNVPSRKTFILIIILNASDLHVLIVRHYLGAKTQDNGIGSTQDTSWRGCMIILKSVWKQERFSPTCTWEVEASSCPPLINAYPVSQDKLILTTDASDVDLGTVFSTEQGTVIEHSSCSLTSAEKNYITV